MASVLDWKIPESDIGRLLLSPLVFGDSLEFCLFPRVILHLLRLSRFRMSSICRLCTWFPLLILLCLRGYEGPGLLFECSNVFDMGEEAEV